MLSGLKRRLTYANVMSTIAVMFAVGGSSAYAVTHLRANSVTSKTIKNGQVKSADLSRKAVTNRSIAVGAVSGDKLAAGAVGSASIATGAVGAANIANGAVGAGKLAAASVSGDREIADESVSGVDVRENSLEFGCSPRLPLPKGTQGPFQIQGSGFCAVMLPPGGPQTWLASLAICSQAAPDSTLATAAQLAQLGLALPSTPVHPFNAPLTVWVSDAVGGGATAHAILVRMAGGVVADMTATPVTNPVGVTGITCVYEPASKNG